MSRTIDFTIVYADITSYDADVIVLKYARVFYGTEKKVAEALSKKAIVDVDSLRLDIGHYEYIETKGVIRAPYVLFLGTLACGFEAHHHENKEFSYGAFRQFSKTVLDALSNEGANAETLAMTIHGVKYGKDEIEAACAEFAGLINGIREGLLPQSLQKISIVDTDRGRVQRLREAFDTILEQFPHTFKLEGSSWTYRIKVEPMPIGPKTIEMVGQESEKKPNVFVAMPLRKNLEDIFHFGIKPSAHHAGFLCGERIDTEAFTGDILQQVKFKIENANVMIAELSGANPNVYLEVGYAWGKGLPTILLVKKKEKIKFDLQGQRHLRYETAYDLQPLLKKELRQLRTKRII